jgi:hypothetical protein
MAENLFNFKNKDFQDIFNELKQKYPDKPEWFLEIISSLFDVMYWYLDFAIQDLFPDSMVSTRNIQKFLKMFGYELGYYSSASTQIKVFLESPLLTVTTIPKENLVFRLFSDTGKSLLLSGYQDLVINSGVNFVIINVVEGEFKRNLELGFTKGIPNEEFILPYSNIDLNFLKVYVNGVEFNRINDLINSTPSGNDYQVNFLSDNRLSIQFGDGNFGIIPANNSYITCDLLITRGLDGNFSSSNNYRIEFLKKVDFPFIKRDGHQLMSDISGGNDKENIYRAKDLAIKSIRTYNAGTNEDSIESLAFRFSSSIYDVKVLPAYFGQYSMAVIIIPYGGGNPSLPLKTALQNYLISKSLLGFSNIVVIDPFYVPVNIDVSVKMRSGYNFLTYEDCIKFVCALSVCENSGEYLQYYRSRDWDKIFQVANIQFGFNLNSLFIAYLSPVFEYLLRKGRRKFGDPFIINDLITMLLNLTFINQVNLNLPVSDITNLNINDITKLGILTVNNIP